MESLKRQVRGEEIRHQEAAKESQNDPPNNWNWGEGPGFSDTSHKGAKCGGWGKESSSSDSNEKQSCGG